MPAFSPFISNFQRDTPADTKISKSMISSPPRLSWTPRSQTLTPDVLLLKTPKNRIKESVSQLAVKKRRRTDSISDGTSFYSDSCKYLEAPFNACVDGILYLSLGHWDLAEALDLVLEWLFAAPLPSHKFSSLYHLLNAADKAPADLRYLLLAIAGLLVNEGFSPKTKPQCLFLAKAKQLLNSGARYVAFGKDQRKPRRNLMKIATAFASPQAKRISDDDNDHIGIDVIIEYVGRILEQKYGTSKKRRVWKFANPKLVWSGLVFDDEGENTETEVDSENMTFTDEVMEFDSPPQRGRGESYGEIPDGDSDEDGVPEYVRAKRPLFAMQSRNLENQTVLDIENQEQTMWQIIEPKSAIGKYLVSLFTDWDHAYAATREVWKVMTDTDGFDLDEVIHGLPILFADYLCTAIQSYIRDGDKL